MPEVPRAQGQGARGPNLTRQAKRPSEELLQIISNGHGPMPALGKQMTQAQLEAIVAHVKQLGAA